jgi:hypothetical protein
MLMGARFSHSTFGDDYNVVCFANSRELVGDDQSRSVARDIVESLLYEAFRLRIKRRGCFVEQ